MRCEKKAAQDSRAKKSRPPNSYFFKVLGFLLVSLIGTSILVSGGSVIIKSGGLNVSNIFYVDPATGNVGIGTTDTSKMFRIHGGVDNEIYITGTRAPSLYLGRDTVFNSNGVNVGLVLSGQAGDYALPSAGDSMLMNFGNDRGNLYIESNYAGTGTKNVIINSKGGNVGIGTANPGATLDVNGAIKFNTMFADIDLVDTTARTYTAGTWYTIGTPQYIHGTWIVQVRAQWDNINYHEWIAGCTVAFTYWEAGGTSTATYNCPLDTHTSGAVGNLQIRGGLSQNGNRNIQINFPASITIYSGGKVEIYMKHIFDY